VVAILEIIVFGTSDIWLYSALSVLPQYNFIVLWINPLLRYSIEFHDNGDDKSSKTSFSPWHFPTGHFSPGLPPPDIPLPGIKKSPPPISNRLLNRWIYCKIIFKWFKCQWIYIIIKFMLITIWLRKLLNDLVYMNIHIIKIWTQY
jgi:hypothetical protein